MNDDIKITISLGQLTKLIANEAVAAIRRHSDEDGTGPLHPDDENMARINEAAAADILRAHGLDAFDRSSYRTLLRRDIYEAF